MVLEMWFVDFDGEYRFRKEDGGAVVRWTGLRGYGLEIGGMLGGMC